uniref:SpaP n=1 Tax=Spirochaeta aurantia TaxID=147 RepID=Q0PHZ0_SPIAU|nr:SpaP [Spirochaeta aurantia]
MRVVVIGGSGFVGTELCRQLKQAGHEPVVFDLEAPKMPEVPSIRGDLRNLEDLARLSLGPDDLVVNLAARQYHSTVPRRARQAFFEDVNTEGVRQLLAYMESRSCRRLVLFSTDMVYGLPQTVPVPTTHRRTPFGPYGTSKKKAEDLCFEARSLGFKVTIVRPRMIMGPGRLGILKKLFGLIERGLPVPMIGSGRNCYQMVSVADCATAVLKIMERGIPNAEINLGSLNPPAVRDLLSALITKAGSRSWLVPTWAAPVKLVLAALGSVGLEIMYREQYMIANVEYVLDLSETERVLGWLPQYSDVTMIEEAFQSYQAEKNKVKATRIAP